jgi:hypothetical protein
MRPRTGPVLPRIAKARLHAICHRQAGRLGLCAIAMAAPAGRAMRCRCRPPAHRRLLAHRGALRLPAEAAERELAGLRIAHHRCFAADMPSPSASSGSAFAIISASGMASIRPRPDHRLCHARRQRRRRVERAVTEVGRRRIVRLAQGDGFSTAQRHRHFGIADPHLAFSGKTGDSTVLQLLAIDGIGEVQHLMAAIAARSASVLAARARRRNIDVASRSLPADARGRPSRWQV